MNKKLFAELLGMKFVLTPSGGYYVGDDRVWDSHFDPTDNEWYWRILEALSSTQQYMVQRCFFDDENRNSINEYHDVAVSLWFTRHRKGGVDEGN